MEETRKDLAQKLESLEKKVAGTVETVTGTVQAVENTVESVKDTIQETVSSVTDKVHDTVEAVEEKVETTVQTVARFFDIPYQVDQRPWLMMGGSVVLGYLAGRLLPGHETPAAAPYEERSYRPTPAVSHAPPERAEASGPSWVGKLSEHFAPEVNKVKELAVGTLFGVARDLLSRWLPSALKEQVTELVDKFTTDLGGKVIREPLLSPADQDAERAEGERRDPLNRPSGARSGYYNPERAGAVR